jgi:hypothetical protein
MLDSICNNSQTCSLTTHPTLLHLTSSQILYSYSLYKKDKQLAQALIPKTQSQVAATSAATMTQLALTRNGCWHTPHSTVSVPKPGTCTWRWTVQVGQATSRICVLDPCGADEFGQGCGGPWSVPAPHDGQQETLPVTNEMLPHLLQFRTEVPDDFAGVLLRLLLSWLLLLSAFLTVFRSSSS